MVPVRCVLVQEQYRDRILEGLRGLTVGDVPFLQNRRPVAPLSYDERQRGFFQLFVQFDSYAGPDRVSLQGRSLRLEEAGLGMMAHEDSVNCTAQHVPGGSLLVYGAGARAGADRREQISTLDVVPSILKFFGFEGPSYLRGAASASLGT